MSAPAPTADGSDPFSGGQPALVGTYRAPRQPGHASPAGPDAGIEPPGPAGEPAVPTISLPKGGGAIRGIGEKFAVNAASGTASLSVPVPASPSRSGSGPELSLGYDSGSGNGIFGYGWRLGTPAITRKTDKGIPRYDDDAESDVFILSGAEDLVPVLEGGRPHVRTRMVGGAKYQVKRYRPRVEGLFARIERWTALADGQSHWRCVTRDNVTSFYGTDERSRISSADPAHADARRTFSWLLTESADSRGNVIEYRYKAENGAGADSRSLHEAGRPPWARTANKYLKSVRYGNVRSRLASPGSGGQHWMFEVVLDYGEHDCAAPSTAEVRPWLCRSDPFSTYRAGFEIRTYRLCQRILIFHHFPGVAGVGSDCLVRSLDCRYQGARGHGARGHGGDPARGSQLGSYLASVTSRGWRRTDGGYLSKAMPPLEFGYSAAVIDDEVRVVDPASARNLPAGVDGISYQWVDLDGEGIPGILSEQADRWWYKANLGGGRLGSAEQLPLLPSLASLASGRQQLMDLAGDGHLDLVQLAGPDPGYSDRTVNRTWAPFQAFSSLPVVAWDSPDLRFTDIDGDGIADVLITCDDSLIWHQSYGIGGFGLARRVATPLDEAAGPREVFTNDEHTLFLADMSGDGLSDLVRVRNGQVCYWPNLGYGRFGTRVEMDDAPRFDSAELFDPARLRFADIDGSGTTDLIYLGRGIAVVYLNQSGNRWAEARQIRNFPLVDDLSAVSATDLLGTGTACLVWSSPLPGDASRPLRYLDLNGGTKPHLLISVRNNLGTDTRISYVSSTKFYLADKAAGTPWVTSLPFPVHVVEQVEAHDRIGRNRFVSRYAYHHGYFDGPEREFRGFGLVEQQDTEQLAALSTPAGGPSARNTATASYLAPVVTKTWFHTGVPGWELRHVGPEPDCERMTVPLADAFALGRMLRDNATLPAGLSPPERREACRSLKGLVLREEIRALDGTALEANPYTTTEHSYAVRAYQPIGPNHHGVFMAHPRQTVSRNYERHVDDPRVAQRLTLEVDEFGNVLRSAAVGYGRNPAAADVAGEGEFQDVQGRTLVTYAESSFTNAVDTGDAWRAPLPAESRTWELTGIRPAVGCLLTATEIFRAAKTTQTIPFDAQTARGPAPRLFAHQQTVYRRDDLSAALPLGRLEALALPERTYQLVFPAGLIASVFGDRVSSRLLEAHGRYLHRDMTKDWWAASGRVGYSPRDEPPAAELSYARDHFFLPHRFTDLFGNVTIVGYDRYDLIVVHTTDPLSNTVSAGPRDDQDRLLDAAVNYRVLQPTMVMDPNRNRAFAAYDTLALLTGTAVAGKVGEHLGDTLEGFDPDLDEQQVAAYVADPLATAGRLLGPATTRVIYDLWAYRRSRHRTDCDPPLAAVLTRATHGSDLRPGDETRIQHLLAYSDGLGRDIQHKSQAAPGPLSPGGPHLDARWIGTGWTIHDNKGNPVRQYEPFFSATHHFEFAAAKGVSPIVVYDPLSRAVASIHPDHSWEKVVYRPWSRQAWDANDTVLADPAQDPDVGGLVRRLPAADYLPTWFEWRQDGTLGEQQRHAADQAAVHARTPMTALLDTLGRPVSMLSLNRFLDGGNAVQERSVTSVTLDIQGNRLALVDALGRTASRYSYDARGRRLHEANMDAGERWELADAGGAPLLTDNSRGFRVRMTYDGLRRPREVAVSHREEPERVAVRTVYGEAQPDATAANLRGRVARIEDEAGVVHNERYDFKGNLLATTRQLAAVPTGPPASANQAVLAPERYPSSYRYDALNRPVRQTAADASAVSLTYNPAGLVDQVTATLPGDAGPTWFVRGTDYNARGQRISIQYGNGVASHYSYDPFTFRLAELRTVRGSRRLQALGYAYDPVGNVTHIGDKAQQTLFFRNKIVNPSRHFTYDALYRLTDATGREHVGQAATGLRLPSRGSAQAGRGSARPVHASDGQAMARYTEHYRYDAAGNLRSVAHRGSDPQLPGWTRVYAYTEPSRLEPGEASNRLSSTRVGDRNAERYAYDEHGNVTAMPSLATLQWDYRDQLHSSSAQAGQDHGQTTFYAYDSAGQRTAKSTTAHGAENRQHDLRARHVYIGLLELAQRYNAEGISRTRTTLRVVDDNHLVALVEQRRPEGKAPARLIRYQCGDHLDSVALELDSAGAIISYEEYLPFGETSYQAVRGGVEAPKRYRYTGKERDEESGLYYHGLRYYAPGLGRWTSVDPAGSADGMAPYAYVRNNPLRLVDPTGAVGVNDEEQGVSREEYPTCSADNPAGIMTVPEVRDIPKATPPPPAPSREQELLNAADAANYDAATTDALVDYYSSTDDPLVRKSALDNAAVRAQAAVHSWERGEYGRSVFNYTFGIIDSFGYTLLGDTHAGTAKNVAIGIVTGGALKGLAPGGFISEAVASTTSGTTGLSADVVSGETGNALLLSTKPKSFSNVFGHNAVGVDTAADAPTFFDQTILTDEPLGTTDVLRGGQPAEFAARPPGFDPAARGWSTIRLPVTPAQAQAALDAARAQSALGPQPYNVLTNSCTTNCITVLRGAGISVPWWARTPVLLRFWAQGQGTTVSPGPGAP